MRLASKWSNSADLKSWTFTLRPGIDVQRRHPGQRRSRRHPVQRPQGPPWLRVRGRRGAHHQGRGRQRPRRAVHARPVERGLPRVPRRAGRLPRGPVVVGRRRRHHDQPPGRQRAVQAADPRQARVRPEPVVLAEELDRPEAAVPRQDHLRAAGRLHGAHPRRQGRHRRHLPDRRHRQPRAGPQGPEPDRAAHQRQQLHHHRAQLAQGAVQRHPAAAGLQLRDAVQRPEHGLLRELPPARRTARSTRRTRTTTRTGSCRPRTPRRPRPSSPR